MNKQPAQDELVSGNVKLNLGGLEVTFGLNVPAKEVKPQRMLPVLQGIANSIIGMAANAAEAEGLAISCKAHCGACCRQPVPVSEAEAYRLAELIEKMPEPRRSTIRERFEQAVGHFTGIGWYERFGNVAASVTDRGAEAGAEVKALVREYFVQGVACPFLEDESCSIHPDRPISCREYLVMSPPEYCADPDRKGLAPVGLPLKTSTAANMTVRTENLKHSPYVILTEALEFVREHPERFPEKTGPEWMKDFFDNVSRVLERSANSTADTNES